MCKHDKLYEKMTALGFAERHAGTQLVRAAVNYAERQPGARMTKEIYPALARVADVSPEAVEKSIRHAVQSAWREAPEEWANFCGPRRPTNMEVVARLVAIADEN